MSGLAGIVPVTVLNRFSELESLLAVNTLRDIIDAGWSYQQMGHGVADEFADETGIQTKTGATYDATDKYYHNPAGYGSDLITGAETYSASNVLYGAAANAADGNTGTNWGPDNNTAHWWQVQFGAAKTAIRAVMKFTAGATNSTGGTVQGSNDGSTWTTLYTHGSAFVNGTTYTWDFSNSTAYLYYRFNLAYSSANAPTVSEFELYEASSPAAMTLESISFVNSPSGGPDYPAYARVVAVMENIGPGGNRVCSVSRDGGVTYTAGTETVMGIFSGSKLIRVYDVALGAQPNGDNLRWKFTHALGSGWKIYGVWLQWRK